MPVSRRQFLAGSAAAGMSLFLYQYVGGVKTVLAAIPGGTLDPVAGIPKFVTPLVIPPVMPRAGTKKMKGGKNGDQYEIAVRQFQQQILPAGLPKTTVWGYGAVGRASRGDLQLPGVHDRGAGRRPVRVKWINDLVDANGNYLPHLLPVDPTLHWANPPGGVAGRDIRPAFTAAPAPYTGPVPIVTHVHGAAQRRRRERRLRRGLVPAGRQQHPGRLRDRAAPGTTRSRRKAAGKRYGATWGPGYAVFQYPERPARDHALVPRPHPGHDPAQRLRRPGRLLPHPRRPAATRPCSTRRTGRRPSCPAPRRARATFPANQTYYEIPHRHPGPLLQRRRLAVLPGHRAFFDGSTAARCRASSRTADVSPIWNPEFFGNTHGRQRQDVAVPRRSSSAATGSASSTAASRGS